MAFVVVLHLSTKHESKAADILQQRTKMRVSQVTQTVAVEADHVYVIAPGLQIEMFDGQLVVSPLQRAPGRHLTIDTFFRTLAHAHRGRALAVVLSGADGDGAIGLREIKGEGGIAIAQSPSDAEYDTMPSSAIATAQVDFILPAAEIGPKLVDLWGHAQRIELPDADSIPVEAKPPKSSAALARAEAALREVMIMLLARTGHDFRAYKRATVLRRIERRLQVTRQSDVPAYLEYLKANQQETMSLLQDMLITVTCFFRDRDAFEALEREVVSSILEQRPPTRSPCS
jgi:two-component system CheB/CheR fusion protein